jgi:hypothetical protein
MAHYNTKYSLNDVVYAKDHINGNVKKGVIYGIRIEHSSNTPTKPTIYYLVGKGYTFEEQYVFGTPEEAFK